MEDVDLEGPFPQQNPFSFTSPQAWCLRVCMAGQLDDFRVKAMEGVTKEAYFWGGFQTTNPNHDFNISFKGMLNRSRSYLAYTTIPPYNHTTTEKDKTETVSSGNENLLKN